MQILSENFGNIDSEQLLERLNKSYQNIINKMHIYRRVSLVNLLEGKHYNTHIRYNAAEQADIRDMFKMIKEQFLTSVLEESYAYTLNEFGWNDIKNGTKNFADNVKDKVTNTYNQAKDWSDEKWQALILKTCPNLKNVMGVLNTLIASSITTAKELTMKLVELFGKIGDKLRDVAIYLGAFGKNKVDDSQIEQIGNVSASAKFSYNNFDLAELTEMYRYKQSALNEGEGESVENESPASEDELAKAMTANMQEDERNFFVVLVDYIKTKLNNHESLSILEAQQTLNENKFGDWLRKKCANNKALSVLLLNSFLGKKIGFFKTLIISLIGSVAIWALAALAPASVILAYTYLVAGILWGVRGVVQLIAKRAVQLRPGETMFQDKRFIISLLLTSASLFISTWGLFKNFMHHLGVAQNKEATAAIAEFLKETNGKPTPEQLKKFLDEHPNVVRLSDKIIHTSGHVTPEQITASIKTMQQLAAEMMKGAPASAWNETLQKGVLSGTIQLPNFSHNITLNIKYPGGLHKWFQTSEFLDVLKKHHLTMDDMENILLQSQNSHGKTYAAVLSSDKITVDFINDLDKALKVHEGGCFDLGAGSTIVDATKRLARLAAVAAPAGSVLSAFFSVFDFMGTDDGYIIASLASEAAQRNYYLVTKIEKKQLDEIALEVGDKKEGVAVAYAANQKIEDKNKEAIKDVNSKQVKKLQQTNQKAAEKINVVLDNIKKWSDTNKHEIAAWYGIRVNSADLKKLADSNPEVVEKWRSEHEKDEMPILMLDPFTLMGYDLACDNAKIRQNPYYFKGIQQKLTVKPLFNKDKNTKEYIGKMFAGLIKNGIEVNRNNNLDDVYITKKDGKFQPVEGIEPNKEIITVGNFTPNEVAQVLNGELNPYSLTDAEHAVNIVLDDKGNVAKTTLPNVNISKIEHYVEDNILPVISNKDTDVYKEILEYSKKNSNFKKLFILDNGEINKEIVLKYEMWFRRSMSSYGLRIDQSTIGNWGLKARSVLNNIFGKNNKEEFDPTYADLRDGKIKFSKEDLNNDWKDIAALAQIIWKYKSDRATWREQIKQANLQNTLKDEAPEEPVKPENKKKGKKIVKPRKNKKDKKSDKGANNDSSDAGSTDISFTSTLTDGTPTYSEPTQTDNNDTHNSDNTVDAKSVKREEWFDNVIVKRINKPSKTLYKILCNLPNVKSFFKLDPDNFNIDNIESDSLLKACLYTRCKTSKQPTDKFWNEKLPAGFISLAKQLGKELSKEDAELLAKAYKEFYNVINKYRNRKASPKDKKAWKNFVNEHATYANIYNLIYD